MLRDALAYAMQRKQFGQPIAEFQLVQAMLADSQAEVYAARCMVVDAAHRRDEGLNVSTEASCCKMFASEMCGRVADRAVQIFGGAGYMAEAGIEPLPPVRGHHADPADRDRAEHGARGGAVAPAYCAPRNATRPAPSTRPCCLPDP
jgi:acyl-CoA dehydrogenase